jgi:hypothetical protein
MCSGSTLRLGWWGSRNEVAYNHDGKGNTAFGSDSQGGMDVGKRTRPQDVACPEAAVSGTDYSPHGARASRSAHAACRGQWQTCGLHHPRRVCWTAPRTGMPRAQAWWTVKRQAMICDTQSRVGLYFGTTSGEVWASADEGKNWRAIAQHLPEIYAVEVAELT